MSSGSSSRPASAGALGGQTVQRDLRHGQGRAARDLLCRRTRRFRVVGIVEQGFGRAVPGNEAEFGRGQPPVHRHQDGAEPGAGEQKRDHFGRVESEISNPVATFDAEFGTQMRGGQSGPAVEIAIGGDAAVLECDRRAVAPKHRMMFEPAPDVGLVRHGETNRLFRRLRKALHGRSGRGTVRPSRAA